LHAVKRRGIRSFLEQLARDAGIADAEGFARKWHILMKGSIVAAGEGDRDAAKRAQQIGRLLLNDEGPAVAGPSICGLGAETTPHR